MHSLNWIRFFMTFLWNIFAKFLVLFCVALFQCLKQTHLQRCQKGQTKSIQTLSKIAKFAKSVNTANLLMLQNNFWRWKVANDFVLDKSKTVRDHFRSHWCSIRRGWLTGSTGLRFLPSNVGGEGSRRFRTAACFLPVTKMKIWKLHWDLNTGHLNYGLLVAVWFQGPDEVLGWMN